MFKSIALFVELIEAEVQPSWGWIAPQCLNILQVISFSFISRRVKELEDNREKFVAFFAFGISFAPIGVKVCLKMPLFYFILQVKMR